MVRVFPRNGTRDLVRGKRGLQFLFVAAALQRHTYMAGRSNPSRRVVYWNLFDFLRAMLCNRGLNKWTGVPRTKIRNLAGFMFCRIHRRSLRLISRSSIRLSPFLTGPADCFPRQWSDSIKITFLLLILKKNLSALILFLRAPQDRFLSPNVTWTLCDLTSLRLIAVGRRRSNYVGS